MKTIKDLKSEAYDLLAQIQYLQNELQKVNQQILNFKEEVPVVEESVEESVKEK